jgi:thiopurine S-methyltransferase
MDAAFWHERWRLGQIGFHRPDVHPALQRYWPELGVEAGARVFVPLCGRSLDMTWLARRGHAVLGVELSPIAIAGFFAHESLVGRQEPAGPFTRHAAGPYEILQGDFFDLAPAATGRIEAWYDRAALVALPPALRRRYAGHLGRLLQPGTRGLLLAHEYAQERMSGPPFSVPLAELHELFDPAFGLELLARDDIIGAAPQFAERGLDSFHELVLGMVRR